MKVIFIGALPPPVTGQAVAGEVLRDFLKARGCLLGTVSLSRDFRSSNQYHDFLARLWTRIGTIVRLAWVLHKHSSSVRGRDSLIVYLQAGQSRASVIRDVLLIWLSSSYGAKGVLYHVHGGAWRSGYEQLPRLLRTVVAQCIGRSTHAAVLGPSLVSMFSTLLPEARIHVVPNFVPQSAKVETEAPARTRILEPGIPINVLFLSNLIRSKGYGSVLECARLLQEEGNRRFVFHLAGQQLPESSPDPVAYIRDHGLENVTYHGFVSGPYKRQLLSTSRVFLLPTQYPSEGLPIALLEAMANGHYVLTTCRGAIADYLPEGGGEVRKAWTAEELAASLQGLTDEVLLRASEVNRESVEEFDPGTHCEQVYELLAHLAST